MTTSHMQTSSRASTILLASGSNAVGQLANGTTIDTHEFAPCMFQIPSDHQRTRFGTYAVQHVAAGGRHTLALLDVGDGLTELWGCGDGNRGQLGTQHTDTSSLLFTLIDLPLEALRQGYNYRLIACSWETSYIVLSCSGQSDILISMGANVFGNLGTTQNDNINGSLHRVDLDHILPSGITRFVVTSLSAGLFHVIVHLKATLADGSTEELTAGWGMARHGQLGQACGSSDIVTSPRVILLDHTHDSVISIALGNQHSVFLHESGRVSGLGSRKKNQLLDLDDQKDVRVLGCTWNGTYIVVDDGKEFRILSTGSHSKGQLGRLVPEHVQASRDISLAPVQFPFTSETRRFVSMACGSEHVLVLFDVVQQDAHGKAREVWGWGWNEHGNLGTGTTSDLVLPKRIWPTSSLTESSSQEVVVGIWAGCGTSWIALVSAVSHVDEG